MDKENKIGILTFHRAINYGAILQAYALQQKINELGVECEIIDYRNDALEKIHRKKNLSDCRSIKDVARYFLIGRFYNKRFTEFRRFLNKFITLTNPVKDRDEFSSKSEEYRALIVGSDQVWNYLITDFDRVYFLEGLSDHIQKSSYAASFGISEIPKNKKKEYNNLLNSFDNISIREIQGKDIIKSLIGREVEVVLDPTLLITKKQWFELVDSKLVTNKYILIYAFSGSKYLMKLAKEIALEKGYKIVVISNSYKKEKGVIYFRSIGPIDFLNLFKHAEFILTNSFHGTAFSINFNKEFFTELLPEKKGVNSRLINILELFKLNDRLLTTSEIEISGIRKIDYNEVNRLLKNEKEKSEKFLASIVKDL